MYKGRIVDVDVHHKYKSPNQLLDYLPSEWREYVQIPDTSRTIPIRPEVGIRFGIDARRLDCLPPDGPEGSSYEYLRKQHLDPFGIDIALLTFDIGYEAGVANPYLAQALARATNQWNTETWLSIPDHRLRGTVLVPTELPEEAAKEIRHWADHPKIAGVSMFANTYRKPFGHPVYHPILEAAAETGLPIVIHVGGDTLGKGGQHAGGYVGTIFEVRPLLNQGAMHHLTSFVTNGVFQKFPKLNVILVEQRFSWLPWVVWRLDASYRLIKKECPWVTELPSTTLRQHLRLSTQPLDDIPAKRMIEFVESFEPFEDMLCFSSDYPHHDTDEPMRVASHMPRAWLPKIYAGNADAIFGKRIQNEVEGERAVAGGAARRSA